MPFLLILLAILTALSIETWLFLRLSAQSRGTVERLAAIETALQSHTPSQSRSSTTGETSSRHLTAPSHEHVHDHPGLHPGEPAPYFVVTTPEGDQWDLGALMAPGLPVLLLFANPDCASCSALMPDAAKWQVDLASTLRTIVISKDEPSAVRAYAHEYGLTDVFLQQDDAVSSLYRTRGTPSAVLIHPTGVVGSPLAEGPATIRGLVDQIAHLATQMGVPDS